MTNALLLLSFILAFTGCASISTYDLNKMQSQLGSTLQNTESIVGKAQMDFQEKKSLVANLEKAKHPGFREVEGELKAKLERMNSALTRVENARKDMSSANRDLAALSYKGGEVRAGEREYDLVHETVNRFEQATNSTNAALLDYSRESNSLADLVAEKKLFYHFDVGAFQKQVQKAVRVAQENQRVMLRDLQRADVDAENAELQEKFKGMEETAQNYSSRANRLGEISKEMVGAAIGSAKVSTLDPEWPAVQRLLGEFETAQRELGQLNESFQRQSEAFRRSRANRKQSPQ